MCAMPMGGSPFMSGGMCAMPMGGFPGMMGPGAVMGGGGGMNPMQCVGMPSQGMCQQPNMCMPNQGMCGQPNFNMGGGMSGGGIMAPCFPCYPEEMFGYDPYGYDDMYQFGSGGGTGACCCCPAFNPCNSMGSSMPTPYMPALAGSQMQTNIPRQPSMGQMIPFSNNAQFPSQIGPFQSGYQFGPITQVNSWDQQSSNFNPMGQQQIVSKPPQYQFTGTAMPLPSSGIQQYSQPVYYQPSSNYIPSMLPPSALPARPALQPFSIYIPSTRPQPGPQFQRQMYYCVPRNSKVNRQYTGFQDRKSSSGVLQDRSRRFDIRPSFSSKYQVPRPNFGGSSFASTLSE